MDTKETTVRRIRPFHRFCLPALCRRVHALPLDRKNGFVEIPVNKDQ